MLLAYPGIACLPFTVAERTTLRAEAGKADAAGLFNNGIRMSSGNSALPAGRSIREGADA
jgi:hypothetical protein